MSGVQLQRRQPHHALPPQTPEHRRAAVAQLPDLGEVRHPDQRLRHLGKVGVPVELHVLVVGQTKREVGPAARGAVNSLDGALLVQPVCVRAHDRAVVRDPLRREVPDLHFGALFEIVDWNVLLAPIRLHGDVVVVQRAHLSHPRVRVVRVENEDEARLRLRVQFAPPLEQYIQRQPPVV